MSFENLQLKGLLLKAIQQRGYTTPTPVQSAVIPIILDGGDVIASANTGTGKTAGFVLPALQFILNNRTKKLPGCPSVLILTPTRELANQVSQSIRHYGKYIRFQSITLFGGMPYGPQLKNLARPVDIVVATPGRLIDHLERKSIDLSQVQILVLDEADRMLDMGFIDEVNKIAQLTPAERQTLLFSATWDGKLAELAKRLLRSPQRVEVDSQPTQINIEQRLHVADNMEHKNRLLQHLLGDTTLTQAIIFSATKQGADVLAQELIAQGYSAAALHGDMKQAIRNRTLMNLRQGKLQVLVATDVAARGINVTSVSHVINYDLPRFAEDYVHRIGRTGRAGAAGTAISFALPEDKLHLERIERYTGKSLPQHIIPGLEPKFSLTRPSTKKRRFRSATQQNQPGGYSVTSKSRKNNNYPPQPHHSRRSSTQAHHKRMTAN